MPRRPSAVRVFAKSLYVLAATWLGTVGILLASQIRHAARLDPTAPFDWHPGTIAVGIVPTALIALSALGMERWAVAVHGQEDQHREWVHALWWSLLPMVMLIETVYLLLWPG